MARIKITDSNFPARLAELRRRACITSWPELARKAGVATNTVYALSKGRKQTAFEHTLQKLADILEVTLGFLLTGSNDGKITYVDRGGKGRNLRPSRKLLVLASGAIVAAAAVIILVVGMMGRHRLETDRRIVAGPVDQRRSKPQIYNGITTTSPTAYRYFAEGRVHLKRLEIAEVRSCMWNALAEDSTFAMAWAMLAHPEVWGDNGERRRCIEKAVESSKNATDFEQLYIGALESWHRNAPGEAIERLDALANKYPNEPEPYRLLGRLYWDRRDAPRAIANYEAAVAVDAHDGMSWNRLAYLNLWLNQYEKALRCAERYVALSPQQHNPYDTRGDILGRMGRADEAIDSYKMALERKPDFDPALQHLGAMDLLTNDFENARACFERLLQSKDPAARARARYFLACIPLSQGRLNTALQELKTGLEGDSAEGTFGDPCRMKLFAMALILVEKGDMAGAKAASNQVLTLYENDTPGARNEWIDEYICALTQCDPPRAAVACDTLDAVLIQHSNQCPKFASRAWVALQDGDYDTAVKAFRRALESESGFLLHCGLAMACSRTEDYEQATEQFDWILGTYSEDRAANALWATKSYFLAGQAYEVVERSHDAAVAYQRFIDLCAGTDVLTDAVTSARERLRELGTQ